MNSEKELKFELEAIKKLLILFLLHNGVSYSDVAKAAGISTKTLYKFIPKNLSRNIEDTK